MSDIVERLRCPPHVHAGSQGTKLDPYVVPQIMREAADEIERMRAALQKIIDDADSDDGATAWDGSEIARAALKGGA